MADIRIPPASAFRSVFDFLANPREEGRQLEKIPVRKDWYPGGHKEEDLMRGEIPVAAPSKALKLNRLIDYLEPEWEGAAGTVEKALNSIRRRNIEVLIARPAEKPNKRGIAWGIPSTDPDGTQKKRRSTPPGPKIYDATILDALSGK